MARYRPPKPIAGAPKEPKGQPRVGSHSGSTMRVGHPTPPSFVNKRQQKQWYKSQYKGGVVAKGSGVVTVYKRGKLVKSKAGEKTLGQHKAELARSRQRRARIKRVGRAGIGMGVAGAGVYMSARSHESTRGHIAAFEHKAQGRAKKFQSTSKTRINLYKTQGGARGAAGRFAGGGKKGPTRTWSYAPGGKPRGSLGLVGHARGAAGRFAGGGRRRRDSHGRFA
jgi:hypothetical protein